MLSFLYFDLHTHRTYSDPEVLSLLSVHNRFNTVQDLCSMGLHPWYLNDLARAQKQLADNALLPHVKAIGECGLDKVRGADWALQLEAFRFQVRLANELNKPLIIHCVRAYEEVLHVLKEERVQVPVIFHGFHKNILLAKRLLDAGYYLSFGAALLKEDSSAAASFALAAPDRIFLETDDAAIPIAQLYDTAAGIRKTSLNTIILQLRDNYKTIFDL